ncbi:RHS element core protein [Salmonella enterica subsp. indica]|uniref:RHS repeat protein n=1 Tax=Salmonella enterica TaxID=28901 RepID=A0A702EF18_SALER|nr:RHS element core protein [Salmonella enterica]HAC6575565.1 RHS repeat protein [Salmonella enterica subsp. indica]HBC0062377.1 RHS repeat protein [Salmonella enterica]HCL5301614.1 RHS repeat protein [Salmonella enterica]
MSGKPAARQGDMTQYGGPVVQGSAGVMIGAPTGVACSVCPGGITFGNPVNPLLGAKVLPGETDFALPGPLPFALSRTYNSYQTKTPALVGIFGPGWKVPSDIRLQIRDNELILNDNGGRSIHFEHLFPGEDGFSRSELFWLVRGGVAKLNESHRLAPLWQALPEELRLSPHIYLATSSAQGPWWVLGWSERVPGVDEVLPAPLPPYRVLTGMVDRFGRTLTFHRDAAGAFTGEITAVTDGAGRHFRLVLTTQAQRAEAARRQAVSAGTTVPVFSDTLPGYTEYGRDNGIRLSAVWLTRDPEYPENLPAAPLVRYHFTPRGELAAVYDRSGTQVRAFTYDDRHRGRMVTHRYAGRPEMRYRYGSDGRVAEQLNPAGLSYTCLYENNCIAITDSLNRREVLHTEGEGGLKRVVKKEHADGSVTRSKFDYMGRLVAQTDAAGRTTEYRPNVVTGAIMSMITPDGRETRFHYNNQNQLTSVTWPDGPEIRRKYDEYGRLTQETARSGDVTRYFYDNPFSELPGAIEDASGSRQTMTWSRYGQLLTFTDCSGYETRYEYDHFGQLTTVHREEGLSQYRAYDSRGRVISTQDAQGRTTGYEYNAAGDLTAVISPDGRRSETAYDAWGNATTTIQGGLTRSMEYDIAGRVTQLTNENGSHTEFSWDVLDRLVQETGFDGRTQRYHYDVTGKLTQSEDEGLVTLWHYDDADRITHRTVNGEPAEQWQYDEHGWLTAISHLSGGHRVAVHYTHDSKGRLTGERQTIHNPETDELLWQHETLHAHNAQGQANRFKPDNLPVVEWLTYGSGYLAGMKLGDTPLIDFTRDRLHRETQRSFGFYELTTAYTAGGQLRSHHTGNLLTDRDYSYSSNGELIRISGPRQIREYGYSDTGRLSVARTHNAHLDIRIPYATDPAGNRLPDPELHPDSTITAWPDNRIAQNAHYVYRHDSHGRLTEKTDLIPEGVIRMDDERTHRFNWDNQHRLVHYTRIQHEEPLVESRYIYDPLGRRMGKRVWQRERSRMGWMELSRKPEVTWYGWDGDRLTTLQTQTQRIQTVYQLGSFTPLLRVETENTELEKTHRRSLAEALQQCGGEDGGDVVFPPELVQMLDRLESEILADRISNESRQWLAQCGLTVEQMKNQMDPVYTPVRKIHLYHCDHRGLPLALISPEGATEWSAEYDEWGNLLNEDNPHNLQQVIRLPGQQYDDESGLYYNRHRYYDPLQGRYITQDPIGLAGGWNFYQYPLNPITGIDPLGLDVIENMITGGMVFAVSGIPGLIVTNSIANSAYQFGYDMDDIVGGAHNGAADALRHCYLMCRMTKTFGSTMADAIGKNHEAAGDRGGQPANERLMDLKNNTVGISCGNSPSKCSDACIEKYNNGQLFGLGGIKADNSIKIKQGNSDASNY